MSNVNTQATTTNTNTKTNLTPQQKAAKAKAMAALARAKAETQKVAVTTGNAVVNGFVTGHETGKQWVVIVVDKINNTSWLVYGESLDSAMTKAKNFAKATVRGTAKLIAVPTAYILGFAWGFACGVFNTFKEVYTNKGEVNIPAEDIKKLEAVADKTEEVTN